MKNTSTLTEPTTNPHAPLAAPLRALAPYALAWLGLAVALSLSGLLLTVTPLVALVLAGTLAAQVLAYRRGGALREVADGVPLSYVLALHLVRAPIGLAFLLEERAGHLPSLFAWRAGPGDLLAGLLSLAVLLRGAKPGRDRATLRAWTLFGAADLAVVVLTAQYLFVLRRDPLMAEAFGRMPYPLLPTFLVPLLLATHALVWKRAASRA